MTELLTPAVGSLSEPLIPAPRSESLPSSRPMVGLTVEALTEMSISPRALRALVLDFLNWSAPSPTLWSTPHGADWQCNTASDMLVAWLHAEHPEVMAETLISTGWRGDALPEPARSRVLSVFPDATALEPLFAHAQAWVGGFVVDLTRRQFVHSSDFPHIEPFATTLTSWDLHQVERTALRLTVISAP